MAISLIFAGASLLLAALGVPLILGKVEPNAFYGFRTRKTLSNTSIWYAANRRAGWAALVGGSVAFAASIFAALLGDALLGEGRGALLSVVMFGLCTVGMVAYAFWYLHGVDAEVASADDERDPSVVAVASQAATIDRILCVCYAAVGAVLAVVAIPLIQHEVPPNEVYGFRTEKTLSDPAIWYQANEVAGWDLLVAGLLLSTAALTLLGVVPRVTGTIRAWKLLTGLMLVLLAGVLAHSFYVLSAL